MKNLKTLLRLRVSYYRPGYFRLSLSSLYIKSSTSTTKHSRTAPNRSPNERDKRALPLRAPAKLEPKDAQADPFVHENSCPQNGSLKIRGGGIGITESADNTEKKVAMSIINKRGQWPSPMGSEEQVLQGIKNSFKIVITNVEMMYAPL